MERLNGFYAAHAWHDQIHEHNIRHDCLAQRQCIFSTARLRHHLDGRKVCQGGHNAAAQNRVVVDNHEAHTTELCHWVSPLLASPKMRSADAWPPGRTAPGQACLLGYPCSTHYPQD